MIVRNPDALDFSYVPQKLRFRDVQIDTIRKTMLEPLRAGISSNLVAFGDSGTGKTSTMKYLAREEKSFIIVYENALSFSSLKMLLIDALYNMGKLVGSRNMSYSDIFRGFNLVSQKKGRKIVLVIDEATNLIKFERDGLYNLLRAGEIYSTPISTILVSMEDPSIYMTERDRKSLGVFSSILFNRYSEDELVRIIEERARIAMVPGSINDDMLRHIGHVAEPFGSARVAIELLQKSIYICEYRDGTSVSIEDVRAAQSMINPYVTESKLSELDPLDLAVLLSICHCLRDDPSTSMSCVLEDVRIVSEQFGVSIRENTAIYRSVKRLENLGIVEGRVVGRGDRQGVAKLIGINDIPVSVLEEKVEALIRRN